MIRRLILTVSGCTLFLFASAQVEHIGYTTSTGATVSKGGTYESIVVIGDPSSSATIGRANNDKVMPGFVPAHFIMLETALKSDSLALLAFYDSLHGINWTSAQNWKEGRIETWEGVEVTFLTEDYPRVTGLNLPSNNLMGELPNSMLEMDELDQVSLGDNSISGIPDLSGTEGYTIFDVSQNSLTFGDLEPNAVVNGLRYSDQALLTAPKDTLLENGAAYRLSFSTDGSENRYQWYRNGQPIPNAESNEFVIASITKENMGEFYCEVTNSLVPDLTLKTDLYSIFVEAPVISGTVFDQGQNPLSNGDVTLFKVDETGAYDTVRVQPLSSSGTFEMENLPLFDYLLMASFEGTDSYNPTYFSNTLFWEDATVLDLEGAATAFDITMDETPSESPNGDGEIRGVLTGEFSTLVAGAPVSIWKNSSEGLPHGLFQGYQLVSLELTDEDGAFNFENLEEGTYRINVQFPGYPMDFNSEIDISVGEKPSEKQVKVRAFISNGKISTEVERITALESEMVNNITVWPNPTMDQFNVDFGNLDGKNYWVSVLDMVGREQIKQKVNDTPVWVGSLKPGTYYLKITDQTTAENLLLTTIRFVKQ